MTKAGKCIIGVAGLLTAIGLMAQYGQGGGFHPGQRPGGARLYNPNTVETLSGEVASVEKIEGMRPGVTSLKIVLKSERQTVAVFLGPSTFLEEAGLQVSAGERLTVTGSRVEVKGEAAILAAELTKGGKSFKLRDDSGRPLWAHKPGSFSGAR